MSGGLIAHIPEDFGAWLVGFLTGLCLSRQRGGSQRLARKWESWAYSTNGEQRLVHRHFTRRGSERWGFRFLEKDLKKDLRFVGVEARRREPAGSKDAVRL